MPFVYIRIIKLFTDDIEIIDFLQTLLPSAHDLFLFKMNVSNHVLAP